MLKQRFQHPDTEEKRFVKPPVPVKKYIKPTESRTPQPVGPRPRLQQPVARKFMRPGPAPVTSLEPVVAKPRPQRPVIAKPNSQRPVVCKPKPQRPIVEKPKSQRAVVAKPKPQRPMVAKPTPQGPEVAKPKVQPVAVTKVKIEQPEPALNNPQVKPPEPKPQRAVVPPSKVATVATEEIVIKPDPDANEPPVKAAERTTVEKPSETPQPKPKDLELKPQLQQAVHEELQRMMIKIQFSEPPQRDALGSFLKKYNFISFKRAESPPKTFEGRVKTIQDFDALCSATDLRCGSSIITVIPNHDFTQYPDSLKTDYNDTMPKYKTVSNINESEPTSDSNAKKVVAKDESIVTNRKVATEEKNSEQNENGGAEIKKVYSAVVVKEEFPAETVKQAAKEQPSAKKAGVEIKNTAFIEEDRKEKEENTAFIKVVKVESVEEETHENTNSVTKETSVKTTTNSINQQDKQIVKSKEPKNIKTNVDSQVKSDQTKSNEQLKSVTSKTVVKAIPNVKEFDVEEHFNDDYDDDDDDYEELDDQDILALMSEGIILDECTGSEEEN